MPKAGQRFGFHNLRHSLATFLVNNEKHTKAVQGLLRYADVSTALRSMREFVHGGSEESMLKGILRNGSSAVN